MTPNPPSIPTQAVRGPAAWLGRELRDRRDWIYELDDEERAELRRALDALRSHTGELRAMVPDVFELRVLAPVMQQ